MGNIGRDKTTPRKTIELRFVVDKVNEMLRQSPRDAVEYRRGILNLFTEIASEANAYGGFSYLPSEFKAPMAEIGTHSHRKLRDGYDDTRVQFTLREKGVNR